MTKIRNTFLGTALAGLFAFAGATGAQANDYYYSGESGYADNGDVIVGTVVGALVGMALAEHDDRDRYHKHRHHHHRKHSRQRVRYYDCDGYHRGQGYGHAKHSHKRDKHLRKAEKHYRKYQKAMRKAHQDYDNHRGYRRS